MPNIELGKLYQYKELHAGKFFKDKPIVPYSNDHQFVVPQYHLTDPRLSISEAVPWEREFYRTSTTKMVVLPCRFDVVIHRAFKSLRESYVFATISFSREKDWVMGWVRESWLEPLENIDDSYEETTRKKVHEEALALMGKMKEKAKLLESSPPQSPKDVFSKMMEKRANVSPPKK
ncbi:MAG: hypothetical protein E6R04_01700 [Spirochaetes bacterium]|nr:MAG: hypothetical protein E6R04_01700 [Spirochaetota bacterium]